MNRRRIVSGLLGAVVALALVGVTQAEAQSAAQFVGKWTVTFAPPAGAPGGGAGGPPPGAGPAGGGGPGGGGGGFRGAPTVIEVTQTGGTLAATMTGGGMGMGMGGGPGGGGAPPAAGGAPPAPQPRAISDVKVVDGALVLSYTQTMGQSGEATPVTLKLTPDGAGMKVEQDLGNGRVRTGTAVKD